MQQVIPKSSPRALGLIASNYTANSHHLNKICLTHTHMKHVVHTFCWNELQVKNQTTKFWKIKYSTPSRDLAWFELTPLQKDCLRGNVEDAGDTKVV